MTQHQSIAPTSFPTNNAPLLAANWSPGTRKLPSMPCSTFRKLRSGKATHWKAGISPRLVRSLRAPCCRAKPPSRASIRSMTRRPSAGLSTSKNTLPTYAASERQHPSRNQLWKMWNYGTEAAVDPLSASPLPCGGRAFPRASWRRLKARPSVSQMV